MKSHKVLIILKCILTAMGSSVALILPIILYSFIGLKNSISQYATVPETNIILMISLCLIALSLSIRKTLLLSSILLCLIAFFNVKEHEILHCVFAYVFYIQMIYIMLISKLKLYGVFIIINLISLFFSLYLFEINSIFLIVGFHLHEMYYILKKELKENFNLNVNQTNS